MPHTLLDKLHNDASELIFEQRVKIERLESEKADLLEALEAARHALYTRASNSTRLRAFKKIKAAIADAKPKG